MRDDSRDQRPGQLRRRAERLEEPVVPEGITGRELDLEVRDELRSLSRETSDRVAGHLVAAGVLLEEDPDLALRHAQFAARIGGRVGAVRETYGAVAYATGDYRTAIKELRTALRITGRHDLLPMIADCERGLGRPERALDIASSPEAESLDTDATIELMIVVAGAYADIGDVTTALGTLEMPALRQKVGGTWHVRLWVAYADLLERAERPEEAHRWLTLAADADTERITDAAERLGRPAPPVVDPGPWEDDEQLTVLDAFVDVDEDEGDEEVEPTADAEPTQAAEPTAGAEPVPGGGPDAADDPADDGEPVAEGESAEGESAEGESAEGDEPIEPTADHPTPEEDRR